MAHVANCERAVHRFGAIKAEYLDGDLADRGQPDDLQIFVDEDEMVRPVIDARIEEPMLLTSDPPAEVLTLASVAVRAAPGEIVEVVRAIVVGARRVVEQLTARIRRPQIGRDNMIDVETALSLQEAILARIARTQPRRQADAIIVRIVARVATQLMEQDR